MKAIQYLSAIIFLSSCTQSAFQSRRSDVLAQSVFANNGASGTIVQPGGGGGASGTVTQPGGGGGAAGAVTQPSAGGASGTVSQPSGTGLPLVYFCSYDQTAALGTSVSTASTIEMTIKDPSGNVVCDVTTGVKDYIVAHKALDFSPCNLTGNSYSITLQDPAHPGSLLYAVDIARSVGMQDTNVGISRPAQGAVWTAVNNVAAEQPTLIGPANLGLGNYLSNAAVGVLWANNPAYASSPPASQCDATTSPLVVDMTPAGAADSGMQLSSPEQGVFFDILGANSYPASHVKKRISWIHNPNYMFLALPLKGIVAGIDQMFGNNTQGPDQRFAANGFAALAKYDANGDGVIDQNDPVFDSLRLWSDRNADGVSQAGELIPLKQLNVLSIDLNYDSSYYERDQYGNESRMRSVVTGAGGETHMIFDLWFALP